MNKLGAPPPFVIQCCHALHHAGYDAYPVGGCVRDMLLSRTPQDWDVCTSALPQQVQSLFPHSLPTGLSFGTVTVLLEGGNIEVTTFRRETGYQDGRRPSAVSFVSSLEQDLSRRDFTINAMALTDSGRVIDPFHGQADLQKHLIRCVGDPLIRLKEDRLRMFRSIRFAAQLGFQLEESLRQALLILGSQPHHLPPDRIRPEIEKILCAPNVQQMDTLISYGLLSCVLPNLSNLDFTPLQQLSPTPLVRWAGFSGVLLHAGVDPLPLLKHLIPHRKLMSPLQNARFLFQQGLPRQHRPWRHCLAQLGLDTCTAAAAMAQVCGDSTPAHTLDATLVQAPCLTPKDLALSGRDLMELGFVGQEIGQIQSMLLTHVLDTPEHNNPTILQRYLPHAKK